MTRLYALTGFIGIFSLTIASAALAHGNGFHHHDHHHAFSNSRGELYDNPADEDFNDHSHSLIHGYFGNPFPSPFEFDPEIDLPEPGLRPAQATQE